ncbi:hypothetical protein Tco_1313577 [Tanacetum coccineum]
MLSPKFAETHNVVLFLEKPGESDGFAKIIDFLKASYVHYALTVNPTIYTSCIEQFWATAKVKTVNDVRQIQALTDKHKLIITETSIRSDLHLKDAGVEVLDSHKLIITETSIRSRLSVYRTPSSNKWVKSQWARILTGSPLL